MARYMYGEAMVATGWFAQDSSMDQDGGQFTEPPFELEISSFGPGGWWATRAWERATERRTHTIQWSNGADSTCVLEADAGGFSETYNRGSGTSSQTFVQIVNMTNPAGEMPSLLAVVNGYGGSTTGGSASVVARIDRIIYPLAAGMIHT
jgi:hypothetical protein